MFYTSKVICVLARGVLLQSRESFVTYHVPSQPAIACSKLTIETLEQGVKYV